MFDIVIYEVIDHYLGLNWLRLKKSFHLHSLGK